MRAGILGSRCAVSRCLGRGIRTRAARRQRLPSRTTAELRGGFLSVERGGSTRAYDCFARLRLQIPTIGLATFRIRGLGGLSVAAGPRRPATQALSDGRVAEAGRLRQPPKGCRRKNRGCFARRAAVGWILSSRRQCDSLECGLATSASVRGTQQLASAPRGRPYVSPAPRRALVEPGPSPNRRRDRAPGAEGGVERVTSGGCHDDEDDAAVGQGQGQARLARNAESSPDRADACAEAGGRP